MFDGNDIPDGMKLVGLGTAIGFCMAVSTSNTEHPVVFQWDIDEDSDNWTCVAVIKCDDCGEFHTSEQPNLNANHPAAVLAKMCMLGATLEQVNEERMMQTLGMDDEEFKRLVEGLEAE